MKNILRKIKFFLIMKIPIKHHLTVLSTTVTIFISFEIVSVCLSSDVIEIKINFSIISFVAFVN